MSSSRTRSRLKTGALFLFSLLLCLTLCEVFLRLRLTDAYYVWPPNLSKVLHPDPSILHGITGPSRLTINSFGVRGGPFSPEQRYRILAVGGSTTICTYLDDTETWPHQTQELLNDRLGAGTVWVGNVGRPGHKTPHHVLQVEKLLRQHRGQIDAVLLLIGVNDLVADLAWAAWAETGEVGEHRPRPNPADLEKLAFSIFPGWDEESSWYLRTAIGRWWTIHWKSRPDAERAPEQDERGSIVALLRRYRERASSFRRELPDLEPGLAVYARNVNEIIDRAEAERVRAIFLTQPTLWREDLTAAERDLLWGGGPGLSRVSDGATYFSVEALAAGMKRYNEALLEVCRARGVECIDLQGRLPRDATTFTDDAHFTELGARRMAKIVAEYLLESEPLRGSSSREVAPDGLRPASPGGSR